MPATLWPVRRSWRPTSRALVNRYEVIEECVARPSLYQRLRQPIALAASMLLATSAVYLGFIYRHDVRVGTPIAVSGKVQMQQAKPSMAASQKPARAATPQPSAELALRPAPLRSPLGTLPAAAPTISTNAALPARRRATPPATPGAMSASASVPADPADKLRADLSRHLNAARANLQRNNLSATRTRLAAAIAVQPDNRDAQHMRSALSTREQERDALLSLARGCSYVAHWACVSRNASDALQVDASSKEAQRLVTLAMQASELQQVAPPVEVQRVTPPVEQASDARNLMTHH
ncbi:hypothetical protein [Paraburkholderia ribeironis]|nr:hypothetical protein [Paraburkholderia ribeironis]